MALHYFLLDTISLLTIQHGVYLTYSRPLGP
jgi:hypothetical protein